MRMIYMTCCCQSTVSFFRSERKLTIVIISLQPYRRQRDQGVRSHPSGLTDKDTHQSYYQIHSITNHGLLPNERVLVYQHEKPRW